MKVAYAVLSVVESILIILYGHWVGKKYSPDIIKAFTNALFETS